MSSVFDLAVAQPMREARAVRGYRHGRNFQRMCGAVVPSGGAHSL